MQIIVSDVPAPAAADRVAYRLSDAVRRRGRASLALSGGSTAPPLIAALARSTLPWTKVGVWQVDERVAPDGHADRNATQLATLREVGCEVHLMAVTDDDLRTAAERYGASLPPQFDVVHLGIGSDGHTASWPPGRPEIPASERLVELVESFNGRARMTLTRRVVNGARVRVVLATGAAKRPIVERWLLEDASLPISAVRRTATQVFLDEAATPAATLY